MLWLKVEAGRRRIQGMRVTQKSHQSREYVILCLQGSGLTVEGFHLSRVDVFVLEEFAVGRRREERQRLPFLACGVRPWV